MQLQDWKDRWNFKRKEKSQNLNVFSLIEGKSAWASVPDLKQIIVYNHCAFYRAVVNWGPVHMELAGSVSQRALSSQPVPYEQAWSGMRM